MNQISTTNDLSIDRYSKIANVISKSSFCPTSFRGKEGDVLVAILMGSEIGLKPLQSLQNISVINGRPCMWGDSLVAIMKAHPEFEFMEETLERNEDEGDTAICKIKRKGEPLHIESFSVKDAKSANLYGKSGPWSNYPRRMLKMRARSFCIRDCFADALKGFSVAEEVSDYKESKEEKKENIDSVKSEINQALIGPLDSSIKINNDNEINKIPIEEDKFSESVIEIIREDNSPKKIDDFISEIGEEEKDSEYDIIISEMKKCETKDDLVSCSKKAKNLSEEDKKKLRNVYSALLRKL